MDSKIVTNISHVCKYGRKQYNTTKDKPLTLLKMKNTYKKMVNEHNLTEADIAFLNRRTHFRGFLDILRKNNV